MPDTRSNPYLQSDPTISRALDAGHFESARRGLAALSAARDGANHIDALAAQYRNAGIEQLAGRIAEAHHATSFNIHAAEAGYTALRASTTASLGAHTAPADVLIANSGGVLGQAQVKYHGSVPSTTFSIADRKYDGMQRVAPADQVESIRVLAAKRGVDHLGTRNYQEVATGTHDRIRLGDVSSSPLSRSDAIRTAQQPHRAARALIGEQTALAVRNGAIAGAAIGGGIALVHNLASVAEGEKDAGDALVDTLGMTAAGAASGAAVSAVAVATESMLVRAGARSLARSAAPVAIGLTALDLGKDFASLLEGRLDEEQFVDRAAGHVFKGTCTWGGMEGGAALGTLLLPGVGTIVGGILGGFLGGLFGASVCDQPARPALRRRP